MNEEVRYGSGKREEGKNSLVTWREISRPGAEATLRSENPAPPQRLSHSHFSLFPLETQYHFTCTSSVLNLG